MFIFFIVIVILAAIIYVPVNAAVSYYYLPKAESEGVFASLMMSRRVNLRASAAMIVLSVLSYITMGIALDGSCAGAKSHVCGDFMMMFFAVPVLIGMFFLFVLSAVWFFGRKPEKIEPPSILN
jgi:hypothetical protein